MTNPNAEQGLTVERVEELQLRLMLNTMPSFLECRALCDAALRDLRREGEPVAWRIDHTANGKPRVVYHGHNAVADYGTGAKSTPLYTRPSADALIGKEKP